MKITKRPFGTLADGTAVSCWTMENAHGLRAELLDDDPVDAETAVVAVLLDKSDDLKEHFSKDERRAMKERLKNLAQTPEGKLIASAVEQVEMIAVILLTTIL